jgi:hypothetical protein
MLIALVLFAKGATSGVEFIMGLVFILAAALIAIVVEVSAHYDVVIKNSPSVVLTILHLTQGPASHTLPLDLHAREG